MMVHFHYDVAVVVAEDELVVEFYVDMELYELKTSVVLLNQQHHQVNYYHVLTVQIEQKMDFENEFQMKIVDFVYEKME